MALNAQQLITLSIGKITGSRSQRGGINLRKSLLVASVLHSARAFYYEEMCNRMEENISINSSSSEETENTKDWEDNATEMSTDNEKEESTCDQELPRVPASCERCCGEDTADKENDSPMVACESGDSKIDNEAGNVEDRLHENVSSSPSDRNVLQDRTSYENNSKMTVVNVTVECTPEPAGKLKRKLTETEEACENILPKKAKTEISTELCENKTYIELKTESSSNISSLVNIFRSSLHGLSGAEGDNSNSFNSQRTVSSSTNHLALQQSTYVAPISRTFDSISTPIAAC